MRKEENQNIEFKEQWRDDKNNLPDPEFSELTGGFLVNFVKGAVETTQETSQRGTQKMGVEEGGESTEKVRRKYGENAEKILGIISEGVFVKTRDLANKANLSQSGVEKIIRKLKNEGVLKRIGPDKSGHWEIVE